ncbi:MAG TPA: hypothetical protein VLN90_00010 [Thioalkalivibrio sp.]|nr:hypothetical protein [Thioalkalivibrio sp.]
MDQKEPEHKISPEQVRRGRRTALVLFAIGFGPMIFATIMFYTGWLNPSGHSNNGELLQPPAALEQLQLEGANGKPLADRFGPEMADAEWMMMVVAGSCGRDCEELLYRARQVNIALGKNANRVNRSAWLGSVPAELSTRWDDEYSSMERLSIPEGNTAQWPADIDPQQQPRILLVDPFGNIIMHYGTEHTGKDMLKDLKHLLKLSQIG